MTGNTEAPTADAPNTTDAALDVAADRLNDALEAVEELDESDVHGASEETLARLLGALKKAESEAEDARKDVVEPEADRRTDVGDSLGPFSRIEGSRNYVADGDGALKVIEAHGEDPLDVCKPKMSAVRDMLNELGIDPDAYLGETKYTYYR